MTASEFILSLLEEDDPTKPLFSKIVEIAYSKLDLRDLSSSYEEMEREVSGLEKWLFDVWGKEMYSYMINRSKERLALSVAFNVASEMGANVLVADGYSFREHAVMKKVLRDRVSEYYGLAPTPSVTSEASRLFFGTNDLKAAFSKGSRLIGDRMWDTMIVENVRDPPRLGRRREVALLTYYPDAPLHEAKKYGVVELHDVARVVEDLLSLIEELSEGAPLVVTGDHGYIFTRGNPALFLWRGWKPMSRYGESYGEMGVEIEGTTVAIGRLHAPGSRDSMIVHGGVSLAESLVPVTVIKEA